MDAEQLKNLFDASQSRSANEKLNFTEEESAKFRKAFDEPEFRKLFSEYMDELQDPKHREENEAYISQLETEKKVPEGKELIRPEPAFVAKTIKTTKSSNHTEKLFLNIVQSLKIAAPSKTTTPKGDCWSVPYSLGPPHMEKDKEGNNAPCFDCCFNPEALHLSKQHKEFRDLLVHTSMEGVEQMYKSQHQDVSLKRDFHIVKGIDYKSGQVPTMMIPIASKSKWDTSNQDIPIPPKQTSLEADKIAKLPSEVPAKVASKTSTPAIKKGFLNNAKTTIYPETIKGKPKKTSSPNIKLTDDQEEIDDSVLSSESSTKKKPLIQEVKPGSTTTQPPKLVEQTVIKTRAPLDNKLAESFMKPVSTTLKMPSTPSHTATSTPVTPSTAAHPQAAATSPAVDSPIDPALLKTSSSSSSGPVPPAYTVKERGNISMGDFDAMKNNVVSNRPSELVYRIELPLVVKAAQVVLDVAEKQLSLTYLDVYRLTIDLPYPVFDTKGSAKYDKVAKCLNVTLPVRPAPIVSAKVVESTEPITEINEIKDGESSSPAKKSSVSHSRWVGSASTDNGNDKPTSSSEELKKEVAEKAKRALEEAAAVKSKRTENESIVPPLLRATSSPPSHEEVSQLQVVGDFTASSTFIGARKGFVFRNGDKGVGYYQDSRGMPVVTSTTSAGNEAINASSVKIERLTFSVDSKQTDTSVALLIQVPHILASSVVVKFLPYEVYISFSAVSSDSKSEVDYGALLTFDSVVCAGGIDINNSKHDTASQNMVIVLMKTRPGIWCSEKAVKQPLFTVVPFSSHTASTNVAETKSNDKANLPAHTPIVSNEIKSLMDRMQIDSNSVLYDLD